MAVSKAIEITDVLIQKKIQLRDVLRQFRDSPSDESGKITEFIDDFSSIMNTELMILLNIKDELTHR